MRKPAFIIGAILLVIGGLITAGVFKYDSRETAEVGPFELSVTQEKKAPINLGWVLMGIGAIVVVVGAVSKK